MTHPIRPIATVRRLTELMAALFVLAVGCTAAAPATQPVQTVSAWGPEVNGLRARLSAPAEIEQNVALSVSIELRCDPASLPSGVARFDRSHPNQRLRLTLTNAATGRVVELKPFDVHLLLASDVHENTEPLDGRPLEPIRALFLLRSARDALTPGAYDCMVSYSDSGHAESSTQGPRPKDVWSGVLHTAPMRITMKPEVLRPVTFLVPKQLHLTRDQKVVFLPEDAERITVMLGNGMYVGTRIICRPGPEMISESLNSTPLQPGGPNPIDDWHAPNLIDDWHVPPHVPPPGGKGEYTIEVFATGDRPHHMSDPEPGADDYKTLWQREFVVRQETPRK
ncbi:MAG TPA: hypothetical protein VGI81_26720 [Tepidisphaeraceae bacterium]|jgi:hypothetical protein